MAKGIVRCSWCGSTYLKDVRHINENIKLGNRFYCSPVCFSSAKNKRIELSCDNLSCKNKFRRQFKDFSLNNFCSRSCAAIFNNIKRWGLSKPKVVLSAEERVVIRLAASSLGGTNRWLNYQSKYTKEYIIRTIKDFVDRENRLPVKKEMYLIYKQARVFFGTWNKAIEAAGFKPNPVLFANHHKANDGHTCDSLAEKIIDDYLFKKGIVHERNFPYPEGTYTADFKIGDNLIEFFGLYGEHKRYDEIIEIKENLVKKFKLNLIKIYPKDLFPVLQLDKILE